MSCVGDLVHNLAISNDQSVTEALKTADDYFKSEMAHDKEEEKGFNRTVINTSRDMERGDNPNTSTEAGTLSVGPSLYPIIILVSLCLLILIVHLLCLFIYLFHLFIVSRIHSIYACVCPYTFLFVHQPVYPSIF